MSIDLVGWLLQDRGRAWPLETRPASIAVEVAAFFDVLRHLRHGLVELPVEPDAPRINRNLFNGAAILVFDEVGDGSHLVVGGRLH